MNLSKKEITILAETVISHTLSGGDVINVLKPVLDSKCPFTALDSIGRRIGKAGADAGDLPTFFATFDRIIEYNAMGSFVIVGQALIWFLLCDFEGVMKKSREYITRGDAWYVCDIIGERSLGHALVDHFDETVPWLKEFLDDETRWVRRSAGVAVHFFSKRVLDRPEKTEILLTVLEPYIEEKQIDFVKGIGWGLKTIGKHHPDLLTNFLKTQLELKKNISRVIIRKAITYLKEDKKEEIRKLLQ
jgi:3-methyladenine DNA glycosylase AlkD